MEENLLLNFKKILKKEKNVFLKIWDLEWYCNKMISFIKNSNYDNYYFITPQELYPAQSINFFDFNNELKKNNKNVFFYFGGIFLNETMYSFSNIKFVLFDSHICFSKAFFGEKEIDYEINNRLDKFVSVITLKNSRVFRLYFYQELNKNLDLRQHKYITFRFSEKKIEKNEKIYINLNCYLDNSPVYDFNIDFGEYLNIDNNDYHQHVMEDKYFKGLIDIVFETHMEGFFLTEKTVRPIFYKKPFIAFGCHRYNLMLKERYGYELFDEIIDYSFDNIINNKERIDALVQEIIRINNKYSINELISLTREKTEKNYNRFIVLSKKNFYSKKINDIFLINKQFLIVE